jgi:diguanylate cyclase (GGDEF)-like protein
MTTAPPGAPPGDDGQAPGRIDALFVVDLASGALLFADAAAGELFGFGTADGALAPRRILPQLVDLTPREFVTRLRRGDRDLEIAVTIEALLSGPFNPGDAVLVRVRGTERLPPVTADERAQRRESLWRLLVRRGFGGADQVRALLHEGIAGLGAEAATLGRIRETDLYVEYAVGHPAPAPGETLPLARTTARDAALRAGTFAVSDTMGLPRFAILEPPVRSFISVAFRVGGDQWCASFASEHPRAEPYDGDDWEYLGSLCDALGRAIENAESEALAEFQRYTDTITGLPNRPSAQKRLGEMIADAHRLGVDAAVLFADLDGFKAVNDTVSHQAGDAVLLEVGQRLRESVRRDEFVARWAGDEFVVLLFPVTLAQIEIVGQRIANVLSRPFEYGGHTFQLGVSIGVAIYPHDATEPEQLVELADAAMYQAKDDPGACIRFRNGRRAGGPHPRGARRPAPAPEDELPPDAPAAVPPPADPDPAEPFSASVLRAEASFEGGLLLQYEPVYDIRDADVRGAQVRVRRIDPDRGLLPDGPLEQTGWDADAARAADAWILREALNDARTFAAAGFDLTVDLRLAAFDPAIFERADADGFEPREWRRVRAGITAAEAADPAEGFLAFLDACARRGVGLVLDDFDGSLTSLQTVAMLPVATLRTTTAALGRIAAQPGGHALLEGTLAGGRALGWRMIAAGVETVDQRDFVIALGVDGVQGPYVGQAMTAVDLVSWLRDRSEESSDS